MPVADRLDVTPIGVTGFGLLVGLAAAGAAGQGWWFLALAGWLLNRLLDGLDGMVARSFGRQTDLGGYLDMVSDVVVYGAIPLGVASGRGDRASWMAAAVLVASFYLNIVAWLYLSALLEKRHQGASSRGQSTSVAMPGGVVEGTETILLFSVLLALPAIAPWTMVVMAAAVTLTAGLHVRSAVQLLDRSGATL